jgi:hypothetical protein
MIDSAITLVFEKLLSHLPNWLISRMYPTAKIESEIKIELRSNRPIVISRTDIPSISIYFTITNLSLVDLILDRLLIELWISQPTLYGAVLERSKVPKRDDTTIYFTGLLTGPQIEHIKKHTHDRTIAEIQISTKAYFESKSGIIKKEKDLHVLDVKVEL